MKTLTAALLLAVFAMLSTACEQHKWSETKQLFKSGESHGGHEEAGSDKTGSHGEQKPADEKKH